MAMCSQTKIWTCGQTTEYIIYNIAVLSGCIIVEAIIRGKLYLLALWTDWIGKRNVIWTGFKEWEEVCQRDEELYGNGVRELKKNTWCEEYSLNNVSIVNVSKAVKVRDSGSSLLGANSHSKTFLLCALCELFNSSII